MATTLHSGTVMGNIVVGIPYKLLVAASVAITALPTCVDRSPAIPGQKKGRQLAAFFNFVRNGDQTSRSEPSFRRR